MAAANEVLPTRIDENTLNEEREPNLERDITTHPIQDFTRNQFTGNKKNGALSDGLDACHILDRELQLDQSVRLAQWQIDGKMRYWMIFSTKHVDKMPS